MLPKYIYIFSFSSLQLLQNLGKADKTTDEIFEEHYLNFNIQQANANRLQKDISNYIRCIKGKVTFRYDPLKMDRTIIDTHTGVLFRIKRKSSAILKVILNIQVSLRAL